MKFHLFQFHRENVQFQLNSFFFNIILVFFYFCLTNPSPHISSMCLAYFTLLYFTLLYFTLLYFTLLYFTLLYFTLLYFTLLYFTLLYFTLLYFTLLYFTLLYFTLLYFTLLYFTLLYSYIANSCKDPRPPPNGKLLLPCDVTFGSTCPVICVEGYVLRGPDLIKCEINRGVVKWDVKNIRCEGKYLKCFI